MFINLTDSNLNCLLEQISTIINKNNSQTCFEFINTIFRREKVKKEGLINHETFTGELYTPD